MIQVDGYKAFHGTMRIVPKNAEIFPYELTGDWLYKPEYKCWYGGGHSYPENVCEVVVDNKEHKNLDKNEPLTREQLNLCRKNNEPVWIEVLCTPEKESGWGLAGTRAAIEQNVTKTVLALWYEDYGNTWIAYSRPPEVTK